MAGVYVGVVLQMPRGGAPFELAVDAMDSPEEGRGCILNEGGKSDRGASRAKSGYNYRGMTRIRVGPRVGTRVGTRVGPPVRPCAGPRSVFKVRDRYKGVMEF